MEYLRKKIVDASMRPAEILSLRRHSKSLKGALHFRAPGTRNIPFARMPALNLSHCFVAMTLKMPTLASLAPLAPGESALGP
jgi:hypothetical protein